MKLRSLFFIFSLLTISVSTFAAPFTTKAKQAILIDALTGAVLFEKNSDEIMAPSSMTKIMTIYMLFERMKQGKLSPEDSFYVSEKAWRKQGSKMFVELGSQVKVKDLIPGILVQSGNDACIVVSEGLAGTEAAFVDSMNETAHELGATKTNFLNSNGWPDEGHVCTARDLATIAMATIKNFPEFYKKYYHQTEFTYNKIRQSNLNPLLYAGVGGDGFKTGHTEVGGHGLVGSAINHKGRRLIMVVNGLPTQKARKEESIKLIQYGFRAFDSVPLFRKGETISTADVWLGDKSEIKLAAAKDVFATVESHEREKMKVELVMPGPIPAPVRAGDQVAKLVITGTFSEKPMEIPVVAAESVEEAGMFGRIKAALMYLLLGHNPKSQDPYSAGTR